jgi:hypothetical protein
LKTRPDRITAEACSLDKERLAYCAIVSVEAIRQAEKPNVEYLLIGVQRWEQIIDHFVEEAEEQRLVQVVFQSENLR